MEEIVKEGKWTYKELEENPEVLSSFKTWFTEKITS